MTATATEEWKHWTEARTASVTAPHGQLALTGTHWLDSEPIEISGLPGLWWASEGLVRLRAKADDDIRIKGAEAPVDGEVALRPDTARSPDLAELGERLLAPIEREGELALRVFDPDSARRAAFAGITVYPYAPEWAVPAVFTPFEAEKTVSVPNADGRERPLEVTGQISFTLAGEPHTLTVSRAGRWLSGVISDATSGSDTYRFRFITLPEPDESGHTVLDLNRAHLPPCAFSDHYICPFPPPDNRLTIAVEAGEKQVLSR
ncbi:DUF1684 domain-containing protein [Kitasatospora cystarginea]|uniref:DUF1684 domain-containing protein n=1 Tax=Kitasatospora cystarginea TaxID=58350 RepID=A0ABP5RD20_9ACTN